MPERQRAVFSLCKLEGKSYQEVAEELNISAGTIHTQIKRANRFLKERIAQHPDLAGLLFLTLCAIF